MVNVDFILGLYSRLFSTGCLPQFPQADSTPRHFAVQYRTYVQIIFSR